MGSGLTEIFIKNGLQCGLIARVSACLSVSLSIYCQNLLNAVASTDMSASDELNSP